MVDSRVVGYGGVLFGFTFWRDCTVHVMMITKQIEYNETVLNKQFPSSRFGRPSEL
jgi:hypothetical protein